MTLRSIHMLPSRSISPVFKQGISIHGSLVYVRALAINQPPARWQVIIPTRGVTTKVEHNYHKRRLKEALRRATFPESTAIDCLIIAKPDMVRASWSEVVAAVQEVLQKTERAFSA